MSNEMLISNGMNNNRKHTSCYSFHLFNQTSHFYLNEKSLLKRRKNMKNHYKKNPEISRGSRRKEKYEQYNYHSNLTTLILATQPNKINRNS